MKPPGEDVPARSDEGSPQWVAEGDIVHVSLGQAAKAGAIGGLVVGLVVGSLVGAMLAWLAGAVLDWQRDLAFTLGIARRLLPFGDQQALLRSVDSLWFLVVPGVALVLALVAAAFGAMLGALVAAAYNRSRRPVRVQVAVASTGADRPPAPEQLPGGNGAAHARRAARLPRDAGR